ncbi:methionine--tRNA ligase, mitochondrial-like isoform X2 [Littorina saxatilis]|uniref:methionine--tRNA ligase, mitochondrial-like isoform X2 n=1 Tax=Littorina saxatilis TaxID=31220 RepID=UPI0038B65542
MSAPIRIKGLHSCLKTTYLSLKRHVHRSCCCYNQSDVTSQDGRKKTFHITTPIFYVNAALLADVAARWQRLKGRDVLFSTGTDEHGLKIQQAAEKHAASPKDYCDKVSAQFKDLFDQSGISYDEFIRTTDTRHNAAVDKFWETLQRRGYIYKGGYEGWYSVSDEAFLTEDEVQDGVTSDGQHAKVSISSGQPVTWTKEENYMFRLTAFQQQLTSWLDSKAIRPSQFEPMVRSWVDDLRDLSISRQRERLTWGIPVPGDETQTVYVWLDALVNYLTVAGYPQCVQPRCWPPQCQIIGKDILRFHAVYWPAFLFAADMAPPRTLLCHSHWTVEGHKMSKSRGNVVDPLERLGRFTADGLRYFLLREGSLGSDGNYSDARAVERINSDLVNSIGNLLSRTTAPSVNKAQEFPPLESDAELAAFFTDVDVKMYRSLQTLAEQADEHYGNYAFSRVIDLALGHIHWANAMVQNHQPWALVKLDDASSEKHLKSVLHVAMETLRVCGILLQPMIPQLTDRLLTRLGVSEEERCISDVCDSGNECARPLGNKVTLLGRIQTGKS